MKSKLNAIVSHRIEVSSGLIIIRIVPDGWDLPQWESGQFAVLGLPVDRASEFINRPYSIASSSKVASYLEFYITLVESGKLTPGLFALRPGDRVFLHERISGHFTLEQVPERKHLILIATGTGLAPYMSMLRTGLECRPDFHTTVLLGARHSWDLGYSDELVAMQRYCPTFHFIPTISRPNDEILPWEGRVGYIQDLWNGGLVEGAMGIRPTAQDSHMLLCGNPGMIKGMLKLLIQDGFVKGSRKEPGQLHVEKYW